jgi:cell migration-inducing and hyaluronan-binding protein
LADNDAMLAANKSLKNEVDAACRNWAVKDLDCDPAGCFGFSFTLDKDFKPDGLGQAARPMPTKFPPWTTQFVRTTTAPDNKSQLKDGIESECYYPKLPPDCTAGAR